MPRISKSELARLLKQYGDDTAVAKKLKVTRQRIHQIRSAYGLPSSRAGIDERNEKIIALFKKGTSRVELVKKFKLSYTQIFGITTKGGKGKGKKKAAAKKRK